MLLLSVKLIQMRGVSVAAIVCDFCHLAVMVSEQVSRSETIKKIAVTAILFELYSFSFMGLQIFGK